MKCLRALIGCCRAHHPEAGGFSRPAALGSTGLPAGCMCSFSQVTAGLPAGHAGPTCLPQALLVAFWGDDFAGALSQADEIVLADIYAAREKNTIGISSDDLRKHMLEQNTNVYYIPEFEDIEKFLLERVKEGDVLITMGAGNIYEVGEDLLKLPGAVIEK